MKDFLDDLLISFCKWMCIIGGPFALMSLWNVLHFTMTFYVNR